MSCKSLKILVVSILFNLLVMPISSTVATVFGYISLIFSVILPIELLYKSRGEINKNQVKIILAMLVVVAVNVLFSSSYLFDSEIENAIKSLVSFLVFLLAISIGKIKYSEKDLCFYFLVMRLFAVILIFYAVVPFDFQYEAVNLYGSKQFTMSMGNPNSTAAKVLFCIVMISIESSVTMNKKIRNMDVIIIIGLVFVLLRLQSRAAFLSAAIFIICTVRQKFNVRRWMVNWSWSIPVVFIPIQLLAAKMGITLLEKGISTGREIMFVDFLNVLSSSTINLTLGDFIQYQISNSHNIIFTLILNFGLIGMLLYFGFWRIECKEVNCPTSKISNFAWVGWIVFVIHSMAESAVMSGAFTFGVIVIMLNRMTKDQLEDNAGFGERYNTKLNNSDYSMGIMK